LTNRYRVADHGEELKILKNEIKIEVHKAKENNNKNYFYIRNLQNFKTNMERPCTPPNYYKCGKSKNKLKPSK
jgi:hypothetical protein